MIVSVKGSEERVWFTDIHAHIQVNTNCVTYSTEAFILMFYINKRLGLHDFMIARWMGMKIVYFIETNNYLQQMNHNPKQGMKPNVLSSGDFLIHHKASFYYTREREMCTEYMALYHVNHMQTYLRTMNMKVAPVLEIC